MEIASLKQSKEFLSSGNYIWPIFNTEKECLSATCDFNRPEGHSLHTISEIGCKRICSGIGAKSEFHILKQR